MVKLYQKVHNNQPEEYLDKRSFDPAPLTPLWGGMDSLKSVLLCGFMIQPEYVLHQK
jgi:hypothetical protein